MALGVASANSSSKRFFLVLGMTLLSLSCGAAADETALTSSEDGCSSDASVECAINVELLQTQVSVDEAETRTYAYYGTRTTTAPTAAPTAAPTLCSDEGATCTSYADCTAICCSGSGSGVWAGTRRRNPLVGYVCTDLKATYASCVADGNCASGNCETDACSMPSMPGMTALTYDCCA